MSKRTSAYLIMGLLTVLLVLTGTGGLQAATVDIPNGSFESPVYRVAPYATANIDAWQKAAVPAWWTQPAEYWTSMAGVFWNVPGATHIDNVDGEQAAFLFAMPGVELYQDLSAVYEVGQSYQLTGGFQGGGQAMLLGVPVELRLYYRDGDGNRVTLGAAEVLNATDESLPHAAHLDSGQLQTLPVLASDPWAGKSIGVQIVSTVPFQTAGGYWRIDDIRLASVPEPASAFLLMGGATLLTWRRGRGKAKM